MKSQIYDQAGGGLLVLLMLTIALIAGQAEPNFREQTPVTNTFQLDAGLSVAIDREGPAKLEPPSSVVTTVLDLPVKVELGLDECACPVSDIPDAEIAPVHND